MYHLSKNAWLWSDFARRTLPFSLPPSLVPPLLVTPKVSSLHKKQESLWLCYHYSYKNMTTTGSYPAYFFVILWHHERQGGGGCLGGSGGTKTCHPLCLTGPENSWFWSRFIIDFFFASLCVWVRASAAVNTCTVRSGQVKTEEGCTEPVDHERRRRRWQPLICSRPWGGPRCPGFRSPAACSPCRSCRSPAPGAPAGVWSGRFAPSEGKPAPLQSGDEGYSGLIYWSRQLPFSQQRFNLSCT